VKPDKTTTTDRSSSNDRDGSGRSRRGISIRRSSPRASTRRSRCTANNAARGPPADASRMSRRRDGHGGRCAPYGTYHEGLSRVRARRCALEARAGEVLILAGENGAGKSTLKKS
jgi:ABC-type glutathione transport system ATPase component